MRAEIASTKTTEAGSVPFCLPLFLANTTPRSSMRLLLLLLLLLLKRVLMRPLLLARSSVPPSSSFHTVQPLEAHFLHSASSRNPPPHCRVSERLALLPSPSSRAGSRVRPNLHNSKSFFHRFLYICKVGTALTAAPSPRRLDIFLASVIESLRLVKSCAVRPG